MIEIAAMLIAVAFSTLMAVTAWAVWRWSESRRPVQKAPAEFGDPELLYESPNGEYLTYEKATDQWADIFCGVTDTHDSAVAGRSRMANHPSEAIN